MGLSGVLANLLVDIPALWNYDWSNGFLPRPCARAAQCERIYIGRNYSRNIDMNLLKFHTLCSIQDSFSFIICARSEK